MLRAHHNQRKSLALLALAWFLLVFLFWRILAKNTVIVGLVLFAVGLASQAVSSDRVCAHQCLHMPAMMCKQVMTSSIRIAIWYLFIAEIKKPRI